MIITAAVIGQKPLAVIQ